MCDQHIPVISFVVVVGIFTLTVISNKICPNDFVGNGGNVCMIRIDREAKYCEAHEICVREGKKRGLRLFIPGNNAPKMLYLFSDFETVFTSYSAMLNRSNDLRAGWRVGDPGYAGFVSTSDDTTIPWQENQPNSIIQSIALYNRRQLYDDWQVAYKATSVICEISHRPTGASVERFQTNWPYHLDNLFVKSNIKSGCFYKVKVPTLITCAKECKRITECRSLYFNKQRRECLLSLYVDCLLPLELADKNGAWVRFGRPDW
ncbi:hypothetical protein D915_004326 [Fasciola hepatica]|uniref:Apple domain-containing protein n=1 Tax=Fasciola hepatica TaxID=6192 RepID=A0A4E0S1R7_FASHE|nr:hypothetical protein D915_004326 [Fasciola hepatica]